MKPTNTLSTLLAITTLMGVASVGFAASPTVTTVANPMNTTTATKPVATSATPAKPAPTSTATTKTTTVKQTPNKTVKTTAVKTNAAGFTCKDGSHSNAKSTRGACSRHGGIAK